MPTTRRTRRITTSKRGRCHVNLTLIPEHADLLERAASVQNVTVTEWVRSTSIRVARRILEPTSEG